MAEEQFKGYLARFKELKLDSSDTTILENHILDFTRYNQGCEVRGVRRFFVRLEGAGFQESYIAYSYNIDLESGEHKNEHQFMEVGNDYLREPIEEQAESRRTCILRKGLTIRGDTSDCPQLVDIIKDIIVKREAKLKPE